MQECKPGDTRVAKGDKFSLSQCTEGNIEIQEIQKITYASVVRSLMYAQVCTRPNIAIIGWMLGRYLVNLGIDHWKASKWVMMYLQTTKDYMFTYRRSDQLEITGYSDLDLVGCQDSKRHTSSYIYMLVGGAVSWRSAKQTLIASFHHGSGIYSVFWGIQPWDLVEEPCHWTANYGRNWKTI